MQFKGNLGIYLLRERALDIREDNIHSNPEKFPGQSSSGNIVFIANNRGVPLPMQTTCRKRATRMYGTESWFLKTSTAEGNKHNSKTSYLCEDEFCASMTWKLCNCWIVIFCRKIRKENNQPVKKPFSHWFANSSWAKGVNCRLNFPPLLKIWSTCSCKLN